MEAAVNRSRRAWLLALAGEELVGVGSYSVLGGNSGRAEVAFAVADHMDHRGCRARPATCASS
jgi:hypothetical protein